MPRLLAIGDIHGCSKALDTLLQFVRPAPEDQIVTLGDYIDRGPDSRGVLDRLIALRATGRLIALRGNHELMMIGAATSFSAQEFWLAVGGREALASYGPGGLQDIPDEHWRFVEKHCVDWHETDRHFFVHANAMPDLPLSEQPSEILHWDIVSPRTPPHESGKIMICGHTEQLGGWPLALPHLICIDTWCYGGGWLTCLDVGSGRIWQANQNGETRMGYIDID